MSRFDIRFKISVKTLCLQAHFMLLGTQLAVLKMTISDDRRNSLNSCEVNLRAMNFFINTFYCNFS